MIIVGTFSSRGSIMTEEFDLDCNSSNFELEYRNLIDEFNKEEIRRYGKDTELREFVGVRLK